jgi:hypothetical protein
VARFFATVPPGARLNRFRFVPTAPTAIAEITAFVLPWAVAG